ncbi:MAG: NADP-dependent isocitrate dehydrogenase, partial [Pseudonocardiales bacterium]|nr:NADP-dependent isocitrate dehydrogenase [Pseudonocardiales bacterium]
EVTRFAQTLERVCIDTVESGRMTKDLAALIGPDTPFLTTEAFLDELEGGLRHVMGL